MFIRLYTLLNDRLEKNVTTLEKPHKFKLHNRIGIGDFESQNHKKSSGT